MVIFCEWHHVPMDHKSSRGLPMTGEETDLGASASPMAGYLGKVQERAAKLEHCPWCTAKGLTYSLRSYRINLQESVTLCTNPQCLFPLVSRSLEDVLARLVPVELAVGKKRKKTQDEEEQIKRSPKQLRLNELDSFRTESVTETLVNQAAIRNEQVLAQETDGGKVNGNDRILDCGVTEKETIQSHHDLVKVTESATSASDGHPQSSTEALLTSNGDEPLLLQHCGTLGVSVMNDDSRLESYKHIHSVEINGPSPPLIEPYVQDKQKSQTCTLPTCENKDGIKSNTEEFSSPSAAISEELVSVPDKIFWWNADNLCWLDSLLVALVKCRSLRRRKPKDEPQHSSVWQLINRYEAICAAVEAHHQTGRDGVVQVPNHVLQKARADLQNLRMSIFKLLQTKLHCQLGQRETPVFAIPLLLAMDSWAEPLFQSTFDWEFKCSECRAATSQRHVKTLPSFTNIMSDWHPLHAAHLAPCNACYKKRQRRTMILENVPPVFMLHFVEGLPDNDVKLYTFDFEGKRYSITNVIQYKHKLHHFVTWVHHTDGYWLEYDDLKHPVCVKHQNLPVPAEEMHIIFWEVDEENKPLVCSPSSTFFKSSASTCLTSPNASPCQTQKASAADETVTCSPDQSLALPHNDTAIFCALAETEKHSNMDTTDMSIGSTTLLDTFEGLSHTDIITLTLVEVRPDLEETPADDGNYTNVLNDPMEKETPDLVTPDSSSAVPCHEMCQSPKVDPQITLSLETNGDGDSTTFVPPAAKSRGRGKGRGAGRGGARGRGRGAGRGRVVNTRKKAASSSAEPQISPDASAASEGVVDSNPEVAAVQDESLSVGHTNTEQETPSSLNQNTHLSLMPSRSPIKHVQMSLESRNLPPPTPITKINPPPVHSTPNPVKTWQIPTKPVPTPQLRTEHTDSFPLKAATMYGGFATTNVTLLCPSQLPTAVHTNKSVLIQPVAPLTKQPFLTPTADKHLKVSLSKKPPSQLPPGLSETEMLRYKLMKKLKSQKKKLAKLNELLGHQGATKLRPDSTILGSPNSVTSSTFDGSTCDDILLDLLSPATTASNLSPDSSGYIEMLAKGQDGGSQADSKVNGVGGGVVETSACVNDDNTGSFMDEFIWQAVDNNPTQMESDALNALELFF